MIGSEGTGTALVMGDHLAVHDCFIQLAGEAMRIDAQSFSSALTQSLTLRAFLLLFPFR
jgi:hypothetical protein